MKYSLTLGLLALSFTAAAEQANRTSKYLVLTTYHVKPSANADFTDLLKNKWVPAMKKGGASPRIFSSAPFGGEAYTYVIASYLDTFSLYDGKSALSKGAGDGGEAAIQAQRAQMIDSRTVTVLRRVPEMSVYREEPLNSGILLVQYNKFNPGKREEFDALWKKEVAPAIKKAGRFVSVWRVALGDDLQYVTTSSLQSYAEFDKGTSASQIAMSADAYAAFNTKVAPLVTSTRREVMRLRKDLMGID